MPQTITATAQRIPGYWKITADQHPSITTVLPSLSKAPEALTALAASVLETSTADIEVSLTVAVPEQVRAALERAAELEAQAERARAEAAEVRSRAVLALDAAEYTRRDIAAAAGLSVPRVQELIRSAQNGAGAQPAPEQSAANEHPVPASYGAE
jgi:hypothetical protein